METLLTALLQHQILQDLEIFSDSSLVTFRTTLQLHNSTNGLAILAVDHLEGGREFTNLHTIYNSGNLGRQFGHLETGSALTTVFKDIDHQTIVISRILVVGIECHTILKGETFDILTVLGLEDLSDGLGRHIVTNGRSHRVKTGESILNGFLAKNGFTKDVTYIDLVTTFVNELNDMETKLRLHNLRHLLRVGEPKSDIGKLRHPLGATAIA